jgi:hypothetical protein
MPLVHERKSLTYIPPAHPPEVPTLHNTSDGSTGATCLAFDFISRHGNHTSKMKPILLLALTPLAALAANFGSCSQALQCGFICCAETELCINSFCIDPSYISSVLTGTAAASAFPTLKNSGAVSSVLSALEHKSGAAESLYSQYQKVMTDAPMPSDLGTLVPSGFTIPTSLNPTEASKSVESLLSELRSEQASHTFTGSDGFPGSHGSHTFSGSHRNHSFTATDSTGGSNSTTATSTASSSRTTPTNSSTTTAGAAAAATNSSAGAVRMGAAGAAVVAAAVAAVL